MRTPIVGKIGGPDPEVNERLVDANEAAAILGMSASWIRTSDVPFVRLGRSRRYRPRDLRDYAATHLSHQLVGGEQ
jgi:hypothetical protein